MEDQIFYEYLIVAEILSPEQSTDHRSHTESLAASMAANRKQLQQTDQTFGVLLQKHEAFSVGMKP